MDKETVLNRVTEIGTCEDDVQRRTMLDELRGELSSIYDRAAALETANAELTERNESLRSANMDLFVQIGTEKKPQDTAPTGDPEPEKRKFENLFNEKGEIK